MLVRYAVSTASEVVAVSGRPQCAFLNQMSGTERITMSRFCLLSAMVFACNVGLAGQEDKPTNSQKPALEILKANPDDQVAIRSYLNSEIRRVGVNKSFEDPAALLEASAALADVAKSLHPTTKLAKDAVQNITSIAADW